MTMGDGLADEAKLAFVRGALEVDELYFVTEMEGGVLSGEFVVLRVGLVDGTGARRVVALALMPDSAIQFVASMFKVLADSGMAKPLMQELSKLLLQTRMN